jgi:serine/threonine-protein kinase
MKFCSLCRRAAPVEAAVCPHDGSPLVEQGDVAPGPGETIAGYRLLDVVAQGAAGTVYLTADRTSGRKLALKLLTADLCRTASIQRIRREARNTVKLSNPHIAGVIECGDHEGRFFIVREWLDGHPLSVAMRSENRMDVARAGAIVGQVCTALVLIHRVGLIHRDLGPSHVFLTSGAAAPTVKLIDIGVAARVAGADGPPDVFGSPRVLSPEAAEGKPINLRSDLYSLGCLLFEMLTGSPVFSGSPEELVAQHASATPPRLRELVPALPPALDQLVAKMLAKQPTARPFNASIVQREIERILVEQKPPPAPAAARRGSPTHQREDDLGMIDTLYDQAFTVEAVRAAVARASEPSSAAEPVPLEPTGGAETVFDTAPMPRPPTTPEPAVATPVPSVATPTPAAPAPVPVAPTPVPVVAAPAPAAPTPEPAIATPVPIKSLTATIMGIPLKDPVQPGSFHEVPAKPQLEPGDTVRERESAIERRVMPFMSAEDFPFEELATDQPPAPAAAPGPVPATGAGVAPLAARAPATAPSDRIDDRDLRQAGLGPRVPLWAVLIIVAGLFVLLSFVGGIALCTLLGCRTGPPGTDLEPAAVTRPVETSR